MRVVDGIPFALERHWARMIRDAAALKVPMPSDSDAVRRSLLELIEANRAFQSTLRLVVVRNRGGLWEGPSSGRASDVTKPCSTGSLTWMNTIGIVRVAACRAAVSRRPTQAMTEGASATSSRARLPNWSGWPIAKRISMRIG